MSNPKRTTEREARVLPALKRYVGDRPGGHVRVRVNSQLLRHVVLHTPGEFAWGDGSAGSADLALSMLYNYFVQRGAPGDAYQITLEGGILVCVTRQSERAYRLYQRFKTEVVSRFPRERFVYTSDELTGWLRRQ